MTSSAKSAGPLDAHHALRSAIAIAVFRADIQRHDARSADAVASAPAPHLRADRIDDTGTIDAGDERQNGSTRSLMASAKTDVEHAIDGRRMHSDADFTASRDRIGHLFIAQNVRRSVLMNNDRFHSCAFVPFADGVIQFCGMPASPTMLRRLAALDNLERECRPATPCACDSDRMAANTMPPHGSLPPFEVRCLSLDLWWHS